MTLLTKAPELPLAREPLETGAHSRALFQKLLALSGGFQVARVRWLRDHFELDIAQQGGGHVGLVLEENRDPSGPVPFGSDHLRLWYRGHELPQALSQKLTLACRRWTGITLGRLAEVVARDPDLSGEGGADEDPLDDIQRELPFVTAERAPTSGQNHTHQVQVSVIQSCNERCAFCQAPLGEALPRPSLDELGRALARLGEVLPGAKWTLTGGEPTLRADLVELTERLLESESVASVSIQTNAVNIGKRPGELAFPRGKLSFLVGFHASTPALYDRCTHTRGLFDLAVRGVRELQRAGHPTELNCVVHRNNLEHLTRFVEDLPELFPGANAPTLHFTVMATPDHRDGVAEQVRYSELVARVGEALERAEELGVRAAVSVSAHRTAIPACILTPRVRAASEYPDLYDHRAAPDDLEQAFRKSEACSSCALGSSCHGLARDYADRFGLSELAALSEVP